MRNARVLIHVVILGTWCLRTLADNTEVAPPTNAFNEAGFPISTMKTLDQIEPRKNIDHLPFAITNSGSYYLAIPVMGAAGSNGIEISVHDVQLDLGGFSLNGVSNSESGIAIIGDLGNILIRNGVIRGWDKFGIVGTNTKDVVVTDVQTSGNGWGGIYLGENALVERCTVYGCGHKAPANDPPLDDGIQVGEFSTIKDCKVRGCAGAGIHGRFHNKVSGCTATDSTKAEGIFVEECSMVSDCFVSKNHMNGMTVGSQCRVVGNNCVKNGVFGQPGSGIFVMGKGSLVENNSVSGNFKGISVDNTEGGGNLIIRNMAGGNTNDFQWTSTDLIGEIIQPNGGTPFSNGSPWANFKF